MEIAYLKKIAIDFVSFDLLIGGVGVLDRYG